MVVVVVPFTTDTVCFMRAGSIARLLALALIGGAALAASASAKPGDLIVSDSGAAKVFRLNPGTHKVSLIATSPKFSTPDGLTFTPNGKLYVADYDAFGGGGGVFRIDPGTGAVHVLVKGSPLQQPINVDYHPSGDFYITDANANAIFRLKRGQTSLDTFDPSLDFSGLEIAPDGRSLIASSFSGSVILDPIGPGLGLPLAGPPDLSSPAGMALAPNGNVFIADSNNDAIYRLNTHTLDINAVSTDNKLNTPYDVALAPNGKLWVANFGAGDVLKVDPKTGSQVAFTSPRFINPEGIEVEPPRCGGKVATIVGSTKPDKLIGSKFDDVISGLGGSDKIFGFGGDDVICGGRSRDRIHPGPGHDEVHQ